MRFCVLYHVGCRTSIRLFLLPQTLRHHDHPNGAASLHLSRLVLPICITTISTTHETSHCIGCHGPTTGVGVARFPDAPYQSAGTPKPFWHPRHLDLGVVPVGGWSGFSRSLRQSNQSDDVGSFYKPVGVWSHSKNGCPMILVPARSFNRTSYS